MTASEDSSADARLNRWSRAKALFDDLVTLPEPERAAALDARCGDDTEVRRFVESLLVADAGFVETRDDPLLRNARIALDQLAGGIASGRRFGAFAVVEEIGRGGMGVVYLAERHDGKVAQRVALKLVASGHLDAEASARLARERRVLATLEHPNIARLIDAGEDPSGIPYFAMEYVKGLPITRWCDERKLSLPDRLRLFRQVCSAVQYAHANLVVHCDIKAGNILVTDGGLPKLLDFGIATTLGMEAAAGENRFLSPQTAAPEQFLGQPASVATDVYALGVLLCELVAGRPPFDGQTGTLRERVLHAVPRLPSEAAPALRRQLRGDIDAIVTKALSKAPSDRYASVEQFDADIERHLATLPIAIRADERGYRAWTFVRRNVLPVSLGAVLAGLVFGFAVATLRQNERLAYERDRAQQVTDFVVGLFRAAKPEEMRGREVTARQLLERGRQQLGGSLAEQPQLKAAMLAAIAEASLSLDDLQGGYQAARESLALLESLPTPPRRELASNFATLIRLENEFGRFSSALEYEERALAFASEMDMNWRTALAVQRSVTFSALARSDESMQVLRDALASQENTKKRGDPQLALVALRLAIKLPSVEGQQLLSAYLPQSPGDLDKDDPLYGEVTNALAIFWREKGDLELAYKYAQEAHVALSRVYGESSSRVPIALNTLGSIRDKMGDDEGSLEFFEKSLKIFRNSYGETPNAARLEHNVGAMLVDLRRVEEAVPYMQRAVAIGSKSFAPTSATLAFFRFKLGWALTELGRYDEAEAELRLALATFERGKAGMTLVETRGDLACIGIKRDRNPTARADLVAAIEHMDKESADEVHRKFLRDCLADAP